MALGDPVVAQDLGGDGVGGRFVALEARVLAGTEPIDGRLVDTGPNRQTPVRGELELGVMERAGGADGDLGDVRRQATW